MQTNDVFFFFYVHNLIPNMLPHISTESDNGIEDETCNKNLNDFKKLFEIGFEIMDNRRATYKMKFKLQGVI